MNHPMLRTMLGALGAFITWSSYGAILYRGFPLVMLYANEYGSGCATGRLAAKIGLDGLVPVVILISGAGWGISAASKRFCKTARLGFIGAALTSVFWLVLVTTLLQAIARSSV
jgi:hypothetical protein